MNNKEQDEMRVQIPDEVLAGKFANLMQVGASKEADFVVLDFIAAVPPSGVMVARIFVTPLHLKQIKRVIDEEINKLGI